MVLYKKSPRSRGGPGSSTVPSRCASAVEAPAPARKRKAADAVEHHRPETPTRARRRKLLLTDNDDDVSFSEILESELLRCSETENAPAAGGEPAAPELQDRPNAAAPPPCASQREEAGDGDDDDVMEISLEEFMGSSAAISSPPRTAQPGSAAAAESIQTSSQNDQSTDGGVVEVSPEAYDEDDMCGLACPPMDEAYVKLILSEDIVQFDPTFIEEYISDL